jgi:hypothetical protein
MTHRAKPRLMVEQLENRLTPSGSQIPAGEFNWTQYSPTGTLGQLIWDGQTLVYRTRVGDTWQSETVANSTDFTRPQYSSVSQLEAASRTAQLLYTSDGTAHALFLEYVYHWQTNTYQTEIQNYKRTSNGWVHVETITPKWQSEWGPNNLVAVAGANNSIHLIFTETNVAATAAGQFGEGTLWYATNKTGRWTFAKIANTADMDFDVWFAGGRWAPRFLSLAVDAQNNAHVTYCPEFYISGAFGTVHSNLMYASNSSGSWQSQLVQGAIDGTADAGLGASVAVAPNGTVAIASYYVDRYPTGSPLSSWLMYHILTPGGWVTTTVVSTPDGYVAGDGPNFTGFAPQLTFNSQSDPTIVFSDEAGQHLPVSYANEVAGQIRTATWSGTQWNVSTVFHQTNPLVNQLFYPVSATFDGQTMYAGVVATSTLDSNLNPTQVDFALTDVGVPDTPVQPAANPVLRTTKQTVPPVVPPVTPTANDPVVSHTAASPPLVTPVQVTGTEAGTTTLIRVVYSDGSGFGGTPFSTMFFGGAAVALGDVNHDGVNDVIVASGAGIPGKVKVYDGVTRKMIASYRPFGLYSGGLSLAVGDITGNGATDIIVGTATGAGQVAVIDGTTGQLIRQFAPYGANYTGGVRVAVGDVNHDSLADVVIAPGDGSRRIRVYSGATIPASTGPLKLLGGFQAFGQPIQAAESVAVSDVNGDGYADIVVATESGAPVFQIYSGASVSTNPNPAPLFTQFAWAADGHGIRVSFAGDTDGDGLPDLVVSEVGTEKVARFLTRQLTPTGWAQANANWIDPMPGAGVGVYVG